MPSLYSKFSYWCCCPLKKLIIMIMVIIIIYNSYENKSFRDIFFPFLALGSYSDTSHQQNFIRNVCVNLSEKNQRRVRFYSKRFMFEFFFFS